jgi:hypothetical protein
VINVEVGDAGWIQGIREGSGASLYTHHNLGADLTPLSTSTLYLRLGVEIVEEQGLSHLGRLVSLE